MLKRILLVLGLTVNTLSHLSADEENLLSNPSFEEDVLGQLAMWQADSYLNNDEARRIFCSNQEVYDGRRSLVIVNILPNDSRVVQWLKVEPDTYYCLSAWVKAEGIAGADIAANISILGSISPSQSLKDTKGKWERLELYGKTEADQHYLAVTLRLGFYNNLVVGKVCFDEARLERLTQPPSNVKIVNFGSNVGSATVAPQLEKKDYSEERSLLLVLGFSFILLSLLLSFGGVLIFRFRMKLKARLQEGVKDTTGLGHPELRRASRKNVQLPIVVEKKLKEGKVEILELKSLNLSESGIFLAADDLKVLSLDDRLHLIAKYKNKNYELGAARVVRKQEAYQKEGRLVKGGFGLSFTATSKEQLKNIKMLLERAKK